MEDGLPKNTVMISGLCRWHQADFLQRRVRVPEHGKPGEPSWRVYLVIAQILMFQYASNLDSVWKRAEGKSENLSLVLAEIGCPCCKWPEGYRALYSLFKVVGLDACIAITKSEMDHELWPVKMHATQHPAQSIDEQTRTDAADGSS